MKILDTNETQQMHAFLDGELSPEERVNFELHLAASPELRDALETERQFRGGLKNHIKKTEAPASLQIATQFMLSAQQKKQKQIFLKGGENASDPVRPIVKLPEFLLRPLILLRLMLKAGRSLEKMDPLMRFIANHELNFEGKPSLDTTGSHDDVNAWIKKRAPFAQKAPVLGSEWRIGGARLDKIQQKHMMDVLYLMENGLDATFSVVNDTITKFPDEAKVQYRGNDYYMKDDGWHRTIAWHENNTGCAMVGNMCIPSDNLLNMAATARSQLQQVG